MKLLNKPTGIIDPFLHPSLPQPPVRIQTPARDYGNNGVWKNLTAINIGAGEYSINADRRGLWAGHNEFEKAPFFVTTKGVMGLRDQLGQTILDASGIKSDTQFLYSTIEDYTDRTVEDTTPIDIPYTSLTFSIQRITNVFIALSFSGYVSGLTGGIAGDYPTTKVQLSVDGVLSSFVLEKQNMRMYCAEETGLTTSEIFSQSFQKIVQLNPGVHTLKLSMSLSGDAGYVFHVTQTALNYITLGK